MTMQRPGSQGVSNNEGVSGNGLGAPSTMSAAASAALGLNPNGNDSQHPPTTSLSRNGSLGRSFQPNASSAQLWGQSSNIPLLSPSELAGASEGKTSGDNGNSNDQLQSLLLAQVRQRLQEQDQQMESYSQAKKRPRTSTESSALDPLSKGSDVSGLLSSSSTLTAGGELGLAAGGISPSLLRSCSSMTIPGGPASLGGISNLLSPSVAELNNALSGNNGMAASGNNNVSQIQQLLRQQQLQELQQLQQLKKREDMKRLTQLQSRDAVLQLMLQQQQQQQQQQQAMSIDTGNSSLAAQLKALQDQQDQQSSKRASSIDEAAVAKYMRSNSQNNAGMANAGQQQINALQALANRGQLDEMPPPPPMVSAVSSLDSVAIMSMLLPSNQQNQNQLQQSSSANRLLGADLSLGSAAGGLGAGANLNSSLLSPMPFHSQSLGNLGNLGSFGMGGGAASYFGRLNSGLSSFMGQNGFGQPGGGPGSALALHPSAADVIYEQRRLAAAAEVSNTVRDSSVGKPPDAFVDRDPDGRARDLPTLLVVPMDHMQLSSHQTLLRYQIEVFRAGEEDTSTHTRGRNKPVQLGQIGIRCRHCKVLPVSRRKRGSVYFPRAVEGFYQAAQNMNSTHLQTGECPLMGNALRQEFANLIATRGVSTGAGRAYWAKQARKLGLRNTENGIAFDKKEPGSNGSTTENGNTSKVDGKTPETTKSSN
eukprot:CAMPEP_0116092032 /NCGR_PEP_ID=MMETSP0327-20121206/7820_1 /TAXON_ID=44447 /ORGANISM="Pseudo-nitzschia delicatissima, Strain B596" /LENGTH=706 /DNA_ID=CAMNT_0003583419 /DNA_START=140 /DNA_END=2260 /DNA_ORIENTATION=-